MDIGDNAASFFREDFPLAIAIVACIILIVGSIVELVWHFKLEKKTSVEPLKVELIEQTPVEKTQVAPVTLDAIEQKITKLQDQINGFTDDMKSMKEIVEKIADKL